MVTSAWTSRRVVRSRVNHSRDNHDALISALIRAQALPYFAFNALLALVAVAESGIIIHRSKPRPM